LQFLTKTDNEINTQV